MLSWLQEQSMFPWLQLYRNKLWLYENKLQPYTKKRLLFLFIAVHLEVLQLFRLWWSGMTMPGSWGFNCVVVEESSQWFDADPTGHIHITTGRPASLDTRKHENHWNNYTCYDTSFCCGRTEPVSISDCLWLRFQLGSSFSMHACVHACVWNVSLYQIKDTFELKHWAVHYVHPIVQQTTRELVPNHTHTRFSPNVQDFTMLHDYNV